MNITLQNGVAVAAPRTRYRLAMRHPMAQAPTFAWSENFDKLNDLRRQMQRLGYEFVGITS